MANREENLKKINENLEELTDEQLEAIAGGDKISRCIHHYNVEMNPNEVQNVICINNDPKNNIGAENPKRLKWTF